MLVWAGTGGEERPGRSPNARSAKEVTACLESQGAREPSGKARDVGGPGSDCIPITQVASDLIGPLRRVDPTGYGGRDGSQPLTLGESVVELGTRTPPRLRYVPAHASDADRAPRRPPIHTRGQLTRHPSHTPTRGRCRCVRGRDSPCRPRYTTQRDKSVPASSLSTFRCVPLTNPGTYAVC